MSEQVSATSAPKRRRTDGENKQLQWLYGTGCGTCGTVKYTASVDVLAQMKQAHLDGQHSSATAGSPDTVGTVGKSEQVSATEAEQVEKTPEAPDPAARAALPARSTLDEACKLLRASPSSADRDVFIFQQPLIRVVTNRMPANDKFDPAQKIASWMKDAVRVMLEPAQETKNMYQGEVSDEHMSSIPTGLKKVLPEIAAQESATKYMEKVMKPDGSFVYVEKKASPPPQDTSTAHESSSKRWVMDILMFALMSGAWCVDNAAVWVPRVLAECKWSLNKHEDIYQAALGGARLMHDRLRKRLPIDRLYLKVWSPEKYMYAILDIFGYVELHDGKVTLQSYRLFQRQVAEHRMRCGDSFQEEAFEECATSVEAMEKLFMQRESEFGGRFSGVGLPREVTVPVGVLYVNQETRPFPTGASIVKEHDACLFYQGMLRAVSSNSILGWDRERLEANISRARDQRSQKFPMVHWKDGHDEHDVS